MPKGFDGVPDDDDAPKCEIKIKALAVKLSGFWFRFVTGIGRGRGGIQRGIGIRDSFADTVSMA